MKLKEISFQEYLSIGYLYLIALGLLGDAIYYKFFGITVVNYTSVTDILLSPISILTGETKTFIAFTVVLTLIFVYFKLLVPYIQKRNKAKPQTQSSLGAQKEANTTEPQETSQQSILFFMAFMVFSMFIGFGIGRGQKLSERIAAGTFEPNYEITFTNDVTERVKVIGQNSMFIFYAREQDTVVTIAPIQENVRSIRAIPAE